jgi:hypothetical protein
MRLTWEFGAPGRGYSRSIYDGWSHDPPVGLRRGIDVESPRPPITKERTWMALDGKRGLCILLPLLFCCSPLVAETDTASKQIRVVFRCDDASATSDAGMEARLIEAFRDHHMCCLWSVIPFPLPTGKAELFGDAARAGVLEIALHGYAHKMNGISEFAGLSYEDQLQKIQKGKESLETGLRLSIPVSVFVPPWNSYDDNTLRALEATHFHCLSASVLGGANSSTALAFLPCTCPIAAIRDAVIAARAALDPNPVIVALFHASDFREISGERGVLTFDQFIDTLQWLARQQDVRVVPTSGVPDASSERYLANHRIQMGQRWLPRRLQAHMPYSLVFLSKEGARNIRHTGRLRLVGFYGAFMSAVGAAAFAAAVIVFAKWPGLASRLLWLSGPVLLVGSLAWAFHSGRFGGRIRILVAVLAAAAWCAGICAAKIRRKTPPFAMKQHSM